MKKKIIDGKEVWVDENDNIVDAPKDWQENNDWEEWKDKNGYVPYKRFEKIYDELKDMKSKWADIEKEKADEDLRIAQEKGKLEEYYKNQLELEKKSRLELESSLRKKTIDSLLKEEWLNIGSKKIYDLIEWNDEDEIKKSIQSLTEEFWFKKDDSDKDKIKDQLKWQGDDQNKKTKEFDLDLSAESLKNMSKEDYKKNREAILKKSGMLK